MHENRYTVTEADHAGYTHHVVDTTAGRVLAVCNTGTHRENRQDAERIAALLNGGPSKEARDAALISLHIQAAITRWQGGAPWRVEIERAAVILAGELDASLKRGAEIAATGRSTATVDLAAYLAYEAGKRDGAGGTKDDSPLRGAHVISKARARNGDTYEVSHYMVGPQRRTAEEAQDDLATFEATKREDDHV